MKIQNFDLVKGEDFQDFPAEGRPALERIVNRLGSQIDLLTTADQNNLTLADNMNVEVITINLQSDVPKQIKLQTLRGRPQGAWIVATSVFDYARLAWALKTETLVEVKVLFDSPTGREVDCKIVFIGN